MSLFTRALAALLAFVILFSLGPPAVAQTVPVQTPAQATPVQTTPAQTRPATPAQGAPAPPLPTELGILVVEGEGEIHHPNQRPAHDPTVRIVDQNQKPVVGAAVVFTLPTEGASGVFANGSKTITEVTDAQGLAAAKGLRVNPVPGKMPIHINASYRGLTARTNLMQFNEGVPGAKATSGGGGHHGKLIIVLAVVAAAGAGGGAYFATHQSSSSNNGGGGTTVTAIGLTPGTGTIGPPH